jgi:hypothetical protein
LMRNGEIVECFWEVEWWFWYFIFFILIWHLDVSMRMTTRVMFDGGRGGVGFGSHILSRFGVIWVKCLVSQVNVSVLLYQTILPKEPLSSLYLSPSRPTQNNNFSQLVLSLIHSLSPIHYFFETLCFLNPTSLL